MSDEVTLGEVYRLVESIDGRLANIEEAVFLGKNSPPVLSRLAALESHEARTPLWSGGVSAIVAGAVYAALSFFGGNRQ